MPGFVPFLWEIKTDKISSQTLQYVNLNICCLCLIKAQSIGKRANITHKQSVYTCMCKNLSMNVCKICLNPVWWLRWNPWSTTFKYDSQNHYAGNYSHTYEKRYWRNKMHLQLWSSWCFLENSVQIFILCLWCSRWLSLKWIYISRAWLSWSLICFALWNSLHCTGFLRVLIKPTIISQMWAIKWQLAGFVASSLANNWDVVFSRQPWGMI